MSKRDRRDMDGRDRDRREERRDWQDDDGQQRRAVEGDQQEGDSLTALKAILSKVASQLRPLNLSAEESIRLVEQLYGSVLQMDSAMAGEADDTRKSSTLAYIHNTTIRRDGDKLAIVFPTAEELRQAQAPAAAEAAGAASAGQQGQQAPAQSSSPAPAGAPTPEEQSAEPSSKGQARPSRPPRPQRSASRKEPRQPAPEGSIREDSGRAAPVQEAQQASGQESGDMPPQQPRVDPAERGPAASPEPEGPEG